MNDPRREILNQVASGTITAEVGAARLAALEPETSAAPVASSAPPRPTETGVKQVKVVARLGNTEIVGDPSVRYAVADGPHKARQDGETMVIDQSPLDDDTSFVFSRPSGQVRVAGLNFGRRLTVRMNPALALSATVQAGNLSVTGVHGALTGDVKAGSCSINDFRGPIQLNVTAGEVIASGRLDRGASTVRCKMGDVRVALDKTSSVRIKAHTTMGEVSIAGADETGANEITLGSGEGTLDCQSLMGTIHIEVG
jgi:DUF4097 and DUF4098 domain-containing protein YvlB